MTAEEKAKAYDEVVNKLIDFFSQGVDPLITRNDAQDFFTELQESEGERIRKALLVEFTHLQSKGYKFAGLEGEKILAWLKKQGQKPNPYSGTSFKYNGHTWGMCARDNGVEILIDGHLKGRVFTDDSNAKEMFIKALECVEEQNAKGYKLTDCDKNSWWEDFKAYSGYSEQLVNSCKTCKDEQKPAETVKPANKVEPKFKVGDIIRFKGNKTLKGETETHKIVSYDNELYVFADGTTDLFCEQDMYELVEPKFHEGDWIIRSAEGLKHNTYLVKEVKDYYVCEDLKGRRVTFTFSNVHKNFKSWDISDAKDGDVLAESKKDVILMFRRIGNTEWDDAIDYHCYYDCYRKGFIVQKGVEYWGDTKTNQLKPATKEQRDTLERAMTNAGFTFDFEKKELKKIEQNPDWSEEQGQTFTEKDVNDAYLKGVCDTKHELEKQGEQKPITFNDAHIIDSALNDYCCKQYGALHKENGGVLSFARLQHLAMDIYGWCEGQIEQKSVWNEEDEKFINDIEESLIAYKILVMDNDMELADYIEKEIDWLKSLKGRVQPHNTWKPSEEQIKVCKEVYADLLSAKGFDLGTVNGELNRMEEQLKKLKG